MPSLSTTLLLGALIAGAARPAEPADAAAPPARPFVELSALARAPERWLGETVETIVQVQGAAPGTWEGFASGLSPTTHVALDVWADSQLLWEPEQYAAPAARLFVEPLTLLASAVRSALRPEGAPRTFGRHTRLRAVVRVEAYTAGRGWLTLLAVEPAEEQVPEGTVLHAIRGLALARQGAHALALSELEKALLPRLPDHARAPLTEARDRARAALAGD